MQTCEFKTLLNESQLITFEELPQELQNEIDSVFGYEEVELFKIRSFEIGGRLHTIAYIETVSDYYVFTYVNYSSSPRITKQEISKTTINVFQLLRNEDERGVGGCSQN
ncbi:hypothetical protein SAMN04488168_1468 [Bacillus sp. 491mf]|uniref:hypothetical protein n=1 Tax=Bacillus sp. 491mf TaxID=1761755 RepID=UPI0008E6A9C4|nr:hypothetical protein [Bacillus sp. 491mf]SFD50310.1 hypothetical protein SAMN04488168_1468 [Bacillus sp. 491mf]